MRGLPFLLLCLLLFLRLLVLRRLMLLQTFAAYSGVGARASGRAWGRTLVIFRHPPAEFVQGSVGGVGVGDRSATAGEGAHA